MSLSPFAILAPSWLVAVALLDGLTCAVYSSQSTSILDARRDTRCYCAVLQGRELLNWVGRLCLVLSSVASFSAKILLMDIWNEQFLELYWITWSHKIFLNYQNTPKPKPKQHQNQTTKNPNKNRHKNEKQPRASLSMLLAMHCNSLSSGIYNHWAF